MGNVKAWGASIAILLFDGKKTVKEVFDIYYKEGMDPDWLMKQIQYVKDHPKEWSMRHGI